MVYHSDEIPLDFGFSLTGLLPMHSVYWNFVTIIIGLSWYKVTFPIFMNRAYFRVTSIALNDVNIRGGNVIKPVCTRNRYRSLFVLMADKGEMSKKNYGHVIHAC